MHKAEMKEEIERIKKREKEMGIGDWGLGIGDWGLGPIPNPQSPIPKESWLNFILFLLYNYNI